MRRSGGRSYPASPCVRVSSSSSSSSAPSVAILAQVNHFPRQLARTAFLAPARGSPAPARPRAGALRACAYPRLLVPTVVKGRRIQTRPSLLPRSHGWSREPRAASHGLGGQLPQWQWPLVVQDPFIQVPLEGARAPSQGSSSGAWAAGSPWCCSWPCWPRWPCWPSGQGREEDLQLLAQRGANAPEGSGRGLRDAERRVRPRYACYVPIAGRSWRRSRRGATGSRGCRWRQGRLAPSCWRRR